ncbi:MAG: hypothetical protein NC187_05030 [Candidatus Amulumruptor caecigallinarius]|nr:hypothetical protein [Candidatus Amulumruptor caecigallinarius]MCM1396836.1 hypothetical protein [Candidatus Amulumruptor caecigallinarius]MCM1454220.1 hypothetical protein [bacterium]
MDAARQVSVADSLRPAIEAMAAVGILNGDTSRDISNYVEGRAYGFFEPAVEERLQCGDSLSAVLDSVRAHLAELLPDVKWPRVYGIVSPYRQAIVNTDTVSLVALNHYLGPDYEAYSGFDPYTRRQKNARLLPYHFTEALLMRDYPQPLDSLNARPADALDVMVHDGAVAAAMMRVIPQAELTDVGGWTPAELAWLREHEAELMAELRDSGRLHSTDPLLKARLVEPGPATMAFRLHAPGRAGRYLGLRMVERYLESHPDASIGSLLADPKQVSVTVQE